MPNLTLKLVCWTLILFASSLFSANAQSESLRWSIIGGKDVGADTAFANYFADQFSLNPDGSFSYQIEKSQLQQEGVWEIRCDSLSFCYGLPQFEQQPDSSRFLVKNGMPYLLFFDGKHELMLNANGKFRYGKLGTFDNQGNWDLTCDSLILHYELLPTQTAVDSIAYRVQAGAPEVILFSDGQEIARQLPGKLESAHRTQGFQVIEGEDSQAEFLGSAHQLQLKNRTLKEHQFSFMDILRGLLGMISMLAFAYLFSLNRKAIDWKLVGTGVALQLVFAVLVLKVPGVKVIFEYGAEFFVEVLNFTKAGSEFVFGGLIDVASTGFIFAFQILPTIVFFSALMSVLYYIGFLQILVYGFAWIMSKTMRLSGAESMAAAGNIFLGQTESPLLVKPYLSKMTQSEIMCLMTGGMATIAGGVFAAYIGYLGGSDPVQAKMFATHLLTASIMSAPAAIVAAKILVPETEKINQELEIPKEKIGANLLDAISNGSIDGLKLAVNVGIMLLVFLAMIDMVNFAVGDKLGEWTGLNEWVTASTGGRYQQFNLQYIFGIVFAPIAWLLGVPSEDIVVIGQLLGEKTIINEFVAYASLGEVKSSGVVVHYKSVLIATYALCGFANFASIGIQIGGIGALAPNKRKTLSALGIRALIGGTIACFMTAAIAGMLAGI